MNYRRKAFALSFAISLMGCSTLGSDSAEKNESDPTAEFQVEDLNFNTKQSNDGSIYSSNNNSLLIGTGQSYQVGDIINVDMSESIDAQDSVEAEMNQKSSYSASGSLSLPAPLDGLNGSLTGGLDTNKKVSGDGSSSQSHSIEGSIACSVTEIFPNGVLKIVGTKRITLQKGSEVVGISGYIRQQDVSTTTNTIPSSRIANAKIYYRGEGKLSEKSSEGWFTNFIGGKYWPF